MIGEKVEDWVSSQVEEQKKKGKQKHCRTAQLQMQRLS